MIGIYKITSPSNKVYIGQSVNIKNRISKYKKDNCKSQTILYNSIIKYGWENHVFEILCECKIEQLNELERYYQDLYSVISENGMNCSLTTTSTKSGRLSDKTIQKLKSLKVKESTKEKMRNRVLTDCHKEKISISLTGRKVSQYTKDKISKSNKGKKRSQECIVKLKNRYISDEEKHRLKNLNIGKKLSKEHKEKISIGNRNKKQSSNWINSIKEKNSKIILDTYNGIYYNSATELSNLLKIKRTTLTAKLSGQNKNNTNYIYC